MRGNSAILKCSIPSFVADFVHVVAWIDEDDNEIVTSNDFTGGKNPLNCLSIRIHPFDPWMKFPLLLFTFFIYGLLLYFKAVIQYYEVEADNEYVIRGNAAIMKCKIPSYISDFVSVDMWSDTDNNTFYPNATEGGH